MKKYISFLFLLIPFLSFSQSIIKVGNTNQITVEKGGMGSDSAIKLPRKINSLYGVTNSDLYINNTSNKLFWYDGNSGVDREIVNNNILNEEIEKSKSYTDSLITTVAIGIGNAIKITNPDTLPFLRYNVVGGIGTYTYFLDASATPITVDSMDFVNNFGVQFYTLDSGMTWVKQIIKLPGADQYVLKNTLSSSIFNGILDYQNETPFTINFADVSQFDTIYTPITNPALRFNITRDVNGFLRVEQTVLQAFEVGIVSNFNDPKSRYFSTEVSFDTITANSGFGLSINPASNSSMDTVGFINFSWRSNGTLTMYRYNGITVAPSIIFTPAVNQTTIPTFIKNDILKMSLLYNNDSSTSTLCLFVNNVKTNEFVVKNLPKGYMGVTIRNTVPNQVARIRNFTTAYIIDKPRYIYVDSASIIDGDGTNDKPFNNLNSLNNYLTKIRGDLNIFLKDYKGHATYRGSIQIPGFNYRKIKISARPGSTVKVLASTLVNSGWTKTPGYSNIYERVHIFGNISNSTNGGGAIIDLDNPLPNLGFRQYNRLSPNNNLSILDTMTGGSYMVSTINKKIYVNPYNNIDPNMLNLEYSNQQFGIGILRGDSAQNYFCNVDIDNIEVRYAYSHNFALQRSYFKIRDCYGVGSAVSNGFGIDDCIGEAYNCGALGNWNDGFNNFGGLELGDQTSCTYFNCWGDYQRVGDGFSNHDGTWVFYGGHANYNGKDGNIPTGKSYLYNFSATGNINGFQTYPAALNVSNSYSELWNCNFNGNIQAGIHLEVGTSPSLTTTVKAYNCTLFDNGIGLFLFNTSGSPSRTTFNGYGMKSGGNTTEITNTTGVYTLKNFDNLAP